ncbi:hypothetical protein ACIPW5_36585 [Streptomyces sp. NPDC090077]|uniref:hypothetical protein n=1 Tax=Streptomyces sp. NPDC090077 TaxID=3365938 RepID=UPI0037F4135C
MADEIRSTGQVPVPDTAVSDAEAAVRLAETLASSDLSQMHDEYRDALEQVIAAKSGTGTLPAADEEAPAVSAEVVDLMAMLEKSVQDAKVTRGNATVHPLPDKKATKKISTAAGKKAVAKKASAKRKPHRSA